MLGPNIKHLVKLMACSSLRSFGDLGALSLILNLMKALQSQDTNKYKRKHPKSQFHSFLRDMFFSPSFDMTFARAISKSSWVT